MDLWVVAAAAGAGYLTRHLQNLPSSEKQRLVVESSSKFSAHTSLESRNLLQQIRDKTCPLRRLARERALADASSVQKDGLDRSILDMEQLSLGSTSGDSRLEQTMVSTTRKSDDVKEDYNVLWLSSLSPGFSVVHNMEFVDTDCSPFELDKFKLLNSRTSRYHVKPLSSLKSGLKEHEKVEEYIYSSVSSPVISTMMPLLITEGTEIISTSNSIPMGIWPNGGKDTIKSDACWSDSSLDSTNSVELPSWRRGSTKRMPGKGSYSPGSPNFMLLLMIGITIGIISRIIANDNEVASLNEQLKQANGLVQDLQEELEMKDKLTMKDLADEDSPPLRIKNPYFFNQEQIPSVPAPQSDKTEASEINRNAEDPSLRSEIEAELEAELERLELNMKTSIVDSGFTELDPELEVGTIHENMKLNLLSRKYDDDSSEADYDEESGIATEETLPPNCAVSPRELTIRLHELMEASLEARIEELEKALQNSQNRFRYLEPESIISQNTTSTPESPASVHE